MAGDAKNPRFRATPPSTERRRRSDRRVSDRAKPYGGVERREGPRRQAELPRSPWRQPLALLLAAGMGVGAAITLGSWLRPRPNPAAVKAEPAPTLDPALLERAQALRDEAEALTPAQVALDERAQRRWMPRLAMIDAALADPATPPQLRAELEATLAATARAGLR